MLRADYSRGEGVLTQFYCDPSHFFGIYIFTVPKSAKHISYCTPNPGYNPTPLVGGLETGQTFADFSKCKYFFKFTKNFDHDISRHSLGICLLFKRGVLTIRHQFKMWVCVKSSKKIKVSSCVEKNIYQYMNYVLSEILHLTPSRYDVTSKYSLH